MTKLGELVGDNLTFPISYTNSDNTVFTTTLDIKKTMLIRHGEKYVYVNSYIDMETTSDFDSLWSNFTQQNIHNISQMYKVLVAKYNELYNKDVTDTRTKTVENAIEINGVKVQAGSSQVIDNSITKNGVTVQAGKTTVLDGEGSATTTNENAIEVDGVKYYDGEEITLENAIEVGGVKVSKAISETVENAVEINGVKVADAEQTTLENAIEINGVKVSNKTTNTTDNRVKRGDNYVELEVETISYAPDKTTETYESGMNTSELLKTGKSVVKAIEENDPEGSNVTTKGGTTNIQEEAGGTTELHSKSGGTTTNRTESGGSTEKHNKSGGTTEKLTNTTDNTTTETEAGGKTITNEDVGGITEIESYVSQGNQGVTMTQQMIDAEIEMRKFNLYNYICDEFAKQYLIFS